MRFNRTTISLTILAISLGAIVYVTEIREQRQGVVNSDNSQTEDTEKIFAFESNEIKNIKIRTQSQTINFVKTDRDVQPWQMTTPEDIEANDAAISFLINLFKQTQSGQKIISNTEELKEYGLDKPRGTILLTLKNQDKYQINLGKSNFDDSRIYAQIIFPNSQTTEPEIFLLSKSFQYGIERDFDEWKAEEQK